MPKTDVRAKRDATVHISGETSLDLGGLDLVPPDVRTTDELLVLNEPNPYETLSAWRDNDADNYAALMDLGDNSIDANATQVWFKCWVKNQKPNVAVIDNGTGMSQEQLVEALRLGSRAERDLRTEMRKYGVGLVVSSLSLGQKVTVLTRDCSGTTSRGVLDLNTIHRQGKFVVFVGEATPEESAFLDQHVGCGHSGTCVWLSELDQLRNQNMTSFSDTLRSRLGRVYRHFLNGKGGARGIRMQVNKVEVTPDDPLMLDHPDTTVRYDNRYEVHFKSASGDVITDDVRVVMVEIPDSITGTGRNAEDSLLRKEGIYVMRNFREIADAETLGMFSKSQSHNRVRIELFFSGTLDAAFGINNQKQLATKRGLDQSIKDKIEADIRNNLSSIVRRKYSQTLKATDQRQSDVLDQAVRGIEEKKRFLLTPPGVREVRKPKSETQDGKVPGPERGGKGERHFSNAVADPSRSPTFQISLHHFGKSGALYEVEQHGNILSIQVNSDHKFYERFVVQYLDDAGKLPVHVQYLYAALAMAEMRMAETDRTTLRVKFLNELSANLSVLLD